MASQFNYNTTKTLLKKQLKYKNNSYLKQENHLSIPWLVFAVVFSSDLSSWATIVPPAEVLILIKEVETQRTS